MPEAFAADPSTTARGYIRSDFVISSLIYLQDDVGRGKGSIIGDAD